MGSGESQSSRYFFSLSCSRDLDGSGVSGRPCHTLERVDGMFLSCLCQNDHGPGAKRPPPGLSTGDVLRIVGV